MATSFDQAGLAQVADRVLAAARPYFARLQRLGIDLSPRPEPAGATIKVPVLDVGAAASYDRSSNNYADAQGSCSLVSVALTSHPKVTVGITPEAAADMGAEAAQLVGDAAVEQSAAKIGNAALAAWHALLPAASATTGPAITLASHTSGSAIDKTDIEAILAATLSGTASGGGRPAWGGCNPGDAALVLSAPSYAKVATIFDAAAYSGSGANPVREGWFDGGLVGFREVLCDPQIASSVIGYVVPYGSIAFSGRAVEVRNPSAYASFAYRRDDRSGLTLTFRELLAGAVDDRLLTVEGQFGGVLAVPGQVLTVKPHA